MSETLITAGADTTDAAATTTETTPVAATTSETTPVETTTTPAEKPAVVEGAPEAYADFTLPEGVTLDTELVKGLAKELNLPQDKAQKVADAAAALAQKGVQAQVAEIERVRGTWADDVRNDKEFGGEKLAENLSRAKSAMDATTTPQLRMLLDRTGLGDHPEVIRHFLKIAPQYLQDTHVPSDKSPNAGKSAAERLYPTPSK